MHATRREVLAGAVAVGALFAGSAGAAPVADARLGALLSAMADQILSAAPEQATSLGLDTGARAGLRARLSDRSIPGSYADKVEGRARLRRLEAFPAAALNDDDRIRYDAVRFAVELGRDGEGFHFGENSYLAAMGGGAVPYVVSQQNGAYSGIPEFLNSQHPIGTRADCDAYIARMNAYARQLDQETERVRRDANAGVIAPDFILDNAIGQITAARAQAAAETTLVQSLVTRAQAKGIDGDFATPAQRIVTSKVQPALDRQLAALKAARARATSDAGVWKLPEGEGYYRWLLKIGTTTGMTPDDIHRMGLNQGAAIDAEMDALLKSQGLTQGSVGERTSALTKDPRFTYPNTDEGRTQLLAYVTGRIAALRALAPQLSRLPLKADVEVRRVPVDIQDGAALGYMNFASLDGARPAIYYINLKDTGLWPRWTIPSLSAHEAIPGHAWQGAYLAENHAEVPLIASVMGFNAFIEGWALYAEQLADEFGLYGEDPFGRLGYLQAQRFRAARLVVDTGLHHKRWTREKAIQTLVEMTGRAEGAARSEIDRYCASPGQACGYKVGHTEIVRLREMARTALGSRFDLRDFDDAVVRTGGVPLTVLETAIKGYIARTGAA
ncbi:MAG: DUF885 family protein [Hyphomonadaceae bacterium]|nr:MAG: hypothetical protein FD160_2102 [Caulobacteraceae bacterium]MBT9444089.1 DUF885 family protein [Hyphomonadaceae bacterium]TPW07328.1 MAG: hypothetical protein FD124_1224 [Alphaproteobacteria bacterium]